MVANSLVSQSASQTPLPRTSEAFNCDFADHSAKQSFRVLSQAVQISNIDFNKQSFYVSTEIQIIPICPGLSDIVLDLGNECILPNEKGFLGSGKITVNDVEAQYTRNRFQVRLDDSDDCSVLNLKNALSNMYAKHPGDLLIHVPEHCIQYMLDQIVFKISINLIVVRPKQGIIFSTNGKENDPGNHMYTYRSGLLSSTRCWLPCVESPNQLAVWRFEFTVPNEMTVVSCGDLIDTIPCTEDESMRTFFYQLLVPVSSINVGFAIGQFQTYTQPDMPEIISCSLPGLMPLLKHTVSTLNRTFTFFEEVLSCRFPYGFYRQVFVNQLPDEINSFAGLSIFSLHLLYHKKILDLVLVSRQHLAHAIAQQYFGCFVNPADFTEFWVTKSLSRYITGLFVERIFGRSEYICQVDKTLKTFCEYESKFGKIIISSVKLNTVVNFFVKNSAPSNESLTATELSYFDPTHPEICSPTYADALYNKGHFILIMLQKRLGKDQFLKVLQRILNVAMQYSQNLTKPIDWFHMIVSGDSFFQTITNVTGRELPSFIDQWIHVGGHVHFEINHTYNRKQNKLELELKQTSLQTTGLQSYVGPLTVMIQELDGCFTHTVQVDAAISKHDIVCHSKGRKQKKKRIPLSTGEEVEIDLSQMDVDSPVMWIRIDPEMTIPRKIHLAQQIHQWEYMLRYECDVIAQFQAIEMLQHFPGHQIQNVLTETVENEKFFYKVRRAAARCLVDVCNRLPEGLLATQNSLITYFQRVYGCKSAPFIPLPNNYVATSSNLQHYFLMLDLPLAISRIRDQGRLHCPREVLDFLLGLIRLNDNSTNRYSDDYYRATLVNALGNTFVPNEHETRHPERMTDEARCVMTEVIHALNVDTMKPSFGKIVTIQCLYVLQSMQHLRHIPLDLDIFWRFATSHGVYSQVRRAALACIVLLIQRIRRPLFADTVVRLIDEVILADPDPYIRYKIAELFCQQPPFVGMCEPSQTAMFPLNTPKLALKLWNCINDISIESRIRLILTDLYFQLYGKNTPVVFNKINHFGADIKSSRRMNSNGNIEMNSFYIQ